ncbi:hypothetical protein NR402_12735 [Acidithiobacillus ferrooxidans]|jgi:hypothetical protein|uniref:hypothetical protein n=1 Tax=Acidithiobacillus ferrooxidans TaxID=920 RepID=UPI00214BD852|nr:hypothetical protein [Acidithiobacillus ferrooxidans]MCR2831142.1 hypothetical protein [Acidithiobacillus ferrooxidans]
MGWYRVHNGRWKSPGRPTWTSGDARNQVDSYYDSGWRLDDQGQRDVVFALFVLFGLWIVVGMAYIFIADYTWTTAAVVMGVLVLFSLFTVGIMRTGGIILRFALWAFLLVVMSVAFSMLWSAAGAKFMSSDGGNVAALAMTVAWLYGAVKLFRLVF